ncbi:hypothetical protein [Azohydromonas caseinilytica]|uniref:Uncharacterized protein n=1 Tax=Azohydromonas caseinilytica TaxID=2728836 RepID=A0A848FDI8_9BURK|nr:hypothetical protein [Azohydromonas caseinilytica]NML18267.1 hypothetical protein [Azohydromonas caseinilytica]
MKKYLFSGAMIGALLIGAFPARAGSYEEDLRWSDFMARSSISRLGRMISARGDLQLRNIFNNTRFNIGPHGFANLSVSKDGSGHTVFVSAEYYLLVNYLADAALVASTRPGYQDCAMQYQLHLTRQLSQIKGSLASGGPGGRLTAPEEFSLGQRAICQDFHKYFPIEERLRNVRDKNLSSVLILGVLHEMGHIALGHQPVDYELTLRAISDDKRRMDEFLRLNTRSRQQEDEADLWATDKAIVLGATTFDIVNPTLINSFVVYTGIDCGSQPADSHTNGVARAENIINRYIYVMESVKRQPIEKVAKDFALQYVELAKKIRSSLSCR